MYHYFLVILRGVEREHVGEDELVKTVVLVRWVSRMYMYQ